MYDYIGCQCPICNQHFRDGDDIVVCPDCGAPYHRSCYAEQGRCSYSAKHGTDFEWLPPEPPKHEIACPHCGAMNEEENNFCKSCGNQLNAAARYARPQEQQGGRVYEDEAGNTYDYRTMYQQAINMHVAGMGIDPNETVDGIKASEWVSYIGPASRTYLPAFRKMEQLHRKVSVSFAAFLFGPLYFFYRKAWRPAIYCSLITAVLAIPSFMLLMILTESSYAAGLNYDTVYAVGSIFSLISLIYRVIRGIFGNYLYKLASADRIRRIQQEIPDPQKRTFVLAAQGGTSMGAVIFVIGLTYLAVMLCSTLLGPNMDALFQLLNF